MQRHSTLLKICNSRELCLVGGTVVPPVLTKLCCLNPPIMLKFRNLNKSWMLFHVVTCKDSFFTPIQSPTRLEHGQLTHCLCCTTAWKATFPLAQRPDVLLERSDEGLQIWSSGCTVSRQAASQWNWVWSQEVWGTAERTWGTKKKTKHSKQFSTGLEIFKSYDGIVISVCFNSFDYHQLQNELQTELNMKLNGTIIYKLHSFLIMSQFS